MNIIKTIMIFMSSCCTICVWVFNKLFKLYPYLYTIIKYD